MFWGGIFFLLLCTRQISRSLAEKEKTERAAKVKSGAEPHPAAEKHADLEEILQGHLEVTALPPKGPLLPPKTGADVSIINVTIVSVSRYGKGEEQEDKEDDDDDDVDKDEDNIPENTVPATQPATTSPVEDNFSYLFSRLSAIESAIHRLNVQFHGMDVKMIQISQSLSKIRTKVNDAEDTIATVSEMNRRNQRQIGQIEGCLKGKRLTRKCYLIFQHFENYATAQQLCHTRGGNLAMPIDQQEYAALAQYIHDSFYPFNWPIWIGINDQRSDGMYLYENGHRVSFFNWYKDPLVTQPNGGILENCVSVSSDDGKWWDNDCSRRMYFVCEY
ncbi:C-type lectin domain family 11 member A [Ascaphus truei]|uniref:C-type lectin domain family 11 member A n=1 Tax=Ascaphus truei TaxID=8439 RepID=UPI003F59CC82